MLRRFLTMVFLFCCLLGGASVYYSYEFLVVRGNGWTDSYSSYDLPANKNIDLLIKRIDDQYYWASNNNYPLIRIEKSISNPDKSTKKYLIFVSMDGHGQILIESTDGAKKNHYFEYRRHKNTFIPYEGAIESESAHLLSQSSILGHGQISYEEISYSKLKQDHLLFLLKKRGQYIWASNGSKMLLAKRVKYESPYDDYSYSIFICPDGDGFIRIRHDTSSLFNVHGSNAFYEEFRLNERGTLSHYRGQPIFNRILK